VCPASGAISAVVVPVSVSSGQRFLTEGASRDGRSQWKLGLVRMIGVSFATRHRIGTNGHLNPSQKRLLERASPDQSYALRRLLVARALAVSVPRAANHGAYDACEEVILKNAVAVFRTVTGNPLGPPSHIVLADGATLKDF